MWGIFALLLLLYAISCAYSNEGYPDLIVQFGGILRCAAGGDIVCLVGTIVIIGGLVLVAKGFQKM